jgi:hypothetical protein
MMVCFKRRKEVSSKLNKLHLIGLAFVGVGLFLVAMSDDSGAFGAVIDVSEGEDGPVLKVAMKTNLSAPVDDTPSAKVLPPGFEA